MMQLLLILLPPSVVGAVAILLCLAPRSGMAAHPAATITKTSTMATYAAAGNAVFLGLSANELAALGGLIVAVISLVIGTAVNVWFKWQHLELARAKAAGKQPCEHCEKAGSGGGDE